MKNYAQVISDLRKNADVEFVNGCVVKGTKLVQRSNGDVVVRVTLNKEVHAYTRDDDGNYVEGTSNIVYIAPFALARAIEECEDIAFLSDSVTTNPIVINGVLSYAKCDIICQPVKEGTDYVNPFSNGEVAKVVKHDNVYHYCVNIKPSRTGLKVADKYIDNLASIGTIGVTNVTSPKVEAEI